MKNLDIVVSPIIQNLCTLSRQRLLRPFQHSHEHTAAVVQHAGDAIGQAKISCTWPFVNVGGPC